MLMALEVGARIVVVPMVDTAEQAREVVRHGKFPPIGERGYNARTRGVGFGLAGMSESLLAQINDSVHLFVQIETPEIGSEYCSNLRSARTRGHLSWVPATYP